MEYSTVIQGETNQHLAHGGEEFLLFAYMLPQAWRDGF